MRSCSAGAHRSLTAALAFLAVLLLAAVGVAGLTVAVMKPFDPDHLGLWVSPRGDFFLGHADTQSGRREILGMWIYLLAVLDLAAIWFAARLILLWAVRRLASRE